jgi:hypothetical protein
MFVVETFCVCSTNMTQFLRRIMRDETLVLLVPAEPDVSALRIVEEATKGAAAVSLLNTVNDEKDSFSAGACCQVEIHIRSNKLKSLLYTRNCHGQRKCTGGDTHSTIVTITFILTVTTIILQLCSHFPILSQSCPNPSPTPLVKGKTYAEAEA